ncbi:MAG: hypothetical protein J6T22_01380 [Bacteroidales bacterium]|jgi:hypothetical protein|nr:hypothetical protein [Bacteroidales bacterium]
MKKLSVICMTILAVAFFASCRGPQGPQGPAGQDGNANVASSTLTIKSSDWQWLDQYGQWMVEIDYPAINNNVFNHGAVLVYMDVDGAWSQVPLTYYYQDLVTNQDGTQDIINCAASIEVATLSDGGVRLFWTESDFYDGYRPDTHDFKIVAIEASVYNDRSDVDYSNYEAVKTAFQLAD